MPDINCSTLDHIRPYFLSSRGFVVFQLRLMFLLGTLSPPQRLLGIIRIREDWGEWNIKRAEAGEREKASARGTPFPSSHRPPRALFLPFLFVLPLPKEASAEERAWNLYLKTSKWKTFIVCCINLFLISSFWVILTDYNLPQIYVPSPSQFISPPNRDFTMITKLYVSIRWC